MYESRQYPMRGIELVRGRGATVWDSSGREYIDMGGASIGTCNVGHCNPRVVRAVQEQVNRLIHVYGIFYNDQRAKLLRKLIEITPNNLGRVFLCNSGSEAVEAAIKFARAHTRRKKIVATMRGFHGKTFGSLSATWKREYRERFKPLVPGFEHVPFGEIEPLRKKIDKDTAGVLLEPIQGESGVRIPPDDYLPEVREICNDYGAILILDEVQTGFGRTGKMFACDHWETSPDIMCVAKSIAGGLPMGAMIGKDEIFDIPPASHTSTFGGNPVVCTAALATIEFILEEKLCERAAELGEYFLNGLQNLESDRIREVRGIGLMCAIELKERARPFINNLQERGVLALASGRTVIRFLPPLVIEQEQLNSVLDVLREVI